MTHELKTWPEYYEEVLYGRKTFEVRLNDRHFQEGDIVNLREWSVTSGYTGRYIHKTVGYVFRGGKLGGLHDNYVVFSLI